MVSVEKILTLVKTHKSDIAKYLYGDSYRIYGPLLKFNKHQQNALCLFTIDNPSALCRFLRVTFVELEKLINNPVYRNYKIEKRKNGKREIFAPEQSLKTIQKRLNYFLQAYYLCVKPNEVHGFVVNPHYLGPRCNIVENAKVHVRKKHVLNIDLKDFFPSITARRVKQIFCSHYFHFDDHLANALTLLTTYQGKLPIGAPTSPVISNFICYQLDSDLIKYCKDNHLTYSRYADDLTFSSDAEISKDIVHTIRELIAQNNFEVNDKKVRLKTSNRKQTVTGLTVNDKVNVDRKLLKKIRAMLHDLSANGITTATKQHFHIERVEQSHCEKFLQRLEGYINFVGQVRGKQDSLYMRHKTEFDKACTSYT